EPPAWSIDLALCRTWPLHRVSAALSVLSVDADFEVVRRLLAGRLSGAVARGEVAPLRARDLFWSLPIRRLDDGPLDSLTRAVGEIEPMLESVNEASSKDDRDREQAEAELRAKIPALPPCACHA